MDPTAGANIVSGTAHGPVVQAAAVQGGIHFHSPRASSDPIVPRQLLPPPRQFANRRRELGDLNDLLAQSWGRAPTVLVLRGPGGVGKTALALRWLAEVAERFPDGQLQAELALSTGEPVAAEDVLGQFLRALGVARRRVPTGLAERTALYRSITADRAIAVLLDNAVSAAQVQVLLPTSVRSLAVVTSRHPLLRLLAEGARTMPVDPLDLQGGIELLTRAIGSDRLAAEQAAAEQLVRLCDGLPVALCVVAARMAARPRRPLRRMVEELHDRRTRLDALSVEKELSVRATFDLAHSGLPPPVRQVYRTLGLHPGLVIPVEAVAAAMGTDVLATRRLLEVLVDASLLDEWGDHHHRFHDLVRAHALDQALLHDSDEARMTSLDRMLRWYLLAARTAGATVMPARRVLAYDVAEPGVTFTLPAATAEPAAALEWLERHRANLVDATRDAAKCDLPAMTYHLADALQPLFILHQHNQDAVEVTEAGLRAAETMGDKAAEYSMRKRLARLYAHLGYFDRAQRHATELLRQAEARKDRRAEASARKSLGQLFAQQGRSDEAAMSLEQSANLLRTLGKQRGEALVLTDLGTVLAGLGRARDATGHLRRAVDLLSGLRPPDSYNLARARAALGAAYVAIGACETAQPLLEEAITTLAVHGAGHERARAHRSMAALGRHTGDDALTARHDRLAESLLMAPEHADPEGLGQQPMF